MKMKNLKLSCLSSALLLMSVGAFASQYYNCQVDHSRKMIVQNRQYPSGCGVIFYTLATNGTPGAKVNTSFMISGIENPTTQDCENAVKNLSNLFEPKFIDSPDASIRCEYVGIGHVFDAYLATDPVESFQLQKYVNGNWVDQKGSRCKGNVCRIKIN